MDDYIAPKLPNRIIPVSKGFDRKIPVRRREPGTGDPLDWDADVFMVIDIDPKQPPTRIDGDVDGSLAVIRLESTLCDTVKTGTTWRIGMSEADTPTFETPILVGTFERNDGK
jgi:hypothetical protein